MYEDEKKHQKAITTKKRCHDALIKIWNTRKCTIDKITVKEICEEVQISRNTFYYHYDDVYSLLQDLEDELLGVHEILFEDFPRVDLSENSCESVPCIYDVLVHILDNKPYYRALLGPYGDQSFIFKHKRVIKGVVQKKLNHDRIEIDSASQNFVLELIASSVIGAYQYLLFSDPGLSPSSLSKLFVKLVYGHFYNIGLIR